MDILSKINDNDIDDFSFKDMDILGKVTYIYDADTCKVCFYYKKDIIKVTCRLVGIDCPEMKPLKMKKNREIEKKASKKARNRLIELVTNCKIDINKEYTKKGIAEILKSNTKIIKIKILETEKYGRILIKIYDESNNCINDKLVNEGHAYVYNGGTKENFEDWYKL